MMTRTGRNDRCPCGSGKKYKRCCGRLVGSGMTLMDARSESPMFAIRNGQSANGVESQPELRFTSQLGFDLDQSVQRLIHQSWAAYNLGYFVDGMEEVLRRLENNLWIVPSDHPTAALNIAKWCIDHQMYLDFARSLVNCCIGWRYPYRRIDDLISLARLLDYFRAPRVLWTSLLGLYVDFAGDDSLNQEVMLRTGVSSNLVELRRSTVNAKEGTFHRFCADHGLPSYDYLLRLVLGSLRIEIQEQTNRFLGEGNYISGPYEQWMAADAFQMRHPWYSLLLPHEQDFVRNGDTAFAACITTDFSFGCAQWWRCVESVLRRRLIAPLGDLVDANPAWVTEDEAYASRRSDEWDWESVFVRILPDARRRQQMSLTQMLILLEKCVSDHSKKRWSNSTVRRKCVEYVGSKLPEFRWVIGELDDVADFRSLMTPRGLNEETIAAFRNAASHDAPMDFENAAAGRLLAIRILDFMHYPRYCVTEKLDELKRELDKKSKREQT